MPVPRLAVIGFASIDEIERPGLEPSLTIGGGAVYAALSAARAGATVRLHVAVGEDFPPDWLPELQRLGVDVTAVEHRPGPTRRTCLRYGCDGERMASATRGASWWERTRALCPPLPSARFDATLLCPAPLDTVRRAAAGAAGSLLIADTSEAFAASGPEAISAFAAVDVFAPSLDEVMRLSGERDEEEAVTALARSFPVLVVKKGQRGLSRHEAGAVLDLPVVPIPAIDPTGAGDATVGALAAAILAGLDPQQQLRIAAEAGRTAIAALGPAALGWRA